MFIYKCFVFGTQACSRANVNTVRRVPTTKTAGVYHGYPSPTVAGGDGPAYNTSVEES